MISAQRFVYVVKQNGSGHDDHVNETIFDDVGEQTAHSRRNKISRSAKIDRRVIVEHIEPDAMRFRQLLCAKSRAFHLFQQSRDTRSRSTGIGRVGTVKNFEVFDFF